MATDPRRVASSTAAVRQQEAGIIRDPAPAPLDDPRQGPTRPAMQFGMRSLLVAISAAAILLAIGSSLSPGFVQNAIVMVVTSSCMVLLPICLGTLALYCSGMRRTYFLGAFAAFVLSSFGGIRVASQMSAISMAGYAGYLAALVITSLLSGFVAVATRRFAERRGWAAPANPGHSRGESQVKTPSSK